MAITFVTNYFHDKNLLKFVSLPEIVNQRLSLVTQETALPPDLSLIVCTLGRTDCLIRLFGSLGQQQTANFEVVLVDQNPPGFLDALLAQHAQGLRLVHVTCPPGLSRARNAGIAQASGWALAFPDDDCWYPPETTGRVMALFTRHLDASFLTCATVDAKGRFSNGRFLDRSQPVTRANIWRAGNSNGVFVRKALAEEIGGFDETLGVGAGTPFGSGEETDFLLRALAAGAHGYFTTEAVTHHDQVDTVFDDAALRRAASYARGFGRTARLNGYGPVFAFYRAGRSLAAAALLALLRRREAALHKLAWARGTLAGYFAALHVKKAPTRRNPDLRGNA